MTLEAFSYGGVDFSPYFVVQKVTIPFLAMQGQYTDLGSADGSLFMYSKRLKGAVTIEATIVTDHSKMTVLETKDKIVGMLANKGLQKLVVPQVPGRYFNAIYDGTLNYDATDDGLADKLSLVFTVPDGVSHSLATQTADNKPYKDVPVNLLMGSEFDRYWSIPNKATIVDGYDGHKAIHVDATGLPSGGVDVQQPIYKDDVQLIKSGGWYTISFYAKGTGFIETYIYPSVVDVDSGEYVDGVFRTWSAADGAHGWTLTDEYVRHSWSFKTRTPLSPTTNTGNMLFRSKAGNSTYISLPKLEQGISATTWSPNPADPEYYSDTITLTNNGTVPTPVNIETEFDHDNGYFAASLDGRYYQIGHPDEIDAVNYKQNETLTHDSFSSDAELDNYTKNNALHRYNPSGTHQQGAFKTAVVGTDERSVLQVSNTGTLVQGWQGPSLTRVIPKDSNGALGVLNPALEVYIDFYATNNLQSGILEVNLTDANDKFVAGVLFRKPATSNKHIEVTFYAGDKEVWSAKSDAKWDNFRGRVSIYKFNNHFWFGLSKLERGKDNHTVSFNYYDDTLKDLMATKYHIWASHWQDQKFMMIQIYDIKLTKQNVEKQANVANFFSPGDKLLINSSEYKSYINDVVDLDDVATGSKPLLLPANSTTTLALAVSSFGHLRKVTATFRERWI